MLLFARHFRLLLDWSDGLTASSHVDFYCNFLNCLSIIFQNGLIFLHSYLKAKWKQQNRNKLTKKHIFFHDQINIFMC